MPDPYQPRSSGSGPGYRGREDRAVQLLAQCIGDIVGIRSEAYTTLVRAAASDNPLDLHLAQAAFQALAPELRRRIGARVRELGPRGFRPTGPAA